MNAMGVVGSPRNKGNTATLVRKILEGAASKGAESNLFCLGDYRIGGCRACMACKQTGECVQDDDMKLLHAGIQEANVLALVFTWGALAPEAYDDVITWMRGRLSGYFDVETVAVIKAADTGAHPVSGRDDLLRRAFEVGVGLAERSR